MESADAVDVDVGDDVGTSSTIVQLRLQSNLRTFVQSHPAGVGVDSRHDVGVGTGSQALENTRQDRERNKMVSP